MRDLDTALLRTFCAVSESNSFSFAAQRVGRTQSAVSDQIKKLEVLAGTQLLVRTTRSVALTRQGEHFLLMARDVLRSVDALSTAFAPDKLEGSISFGAPEDFASAYLPDIISAFAAAHPKVRLHVTCELTLELVEKLRLGERDLVVIKTDPDNRLAGATPLWREDLVWIGRARPRKLFNTLFGHASASKATFPLISAPPQCVYRSRAVRALDNALVSWANVYVSPSIAGALAAVRAGLGFMVIPKTMVPSDLVIIGKESEWPSLQQAELCLLGIQHPTPQAKAFAKFIHENTLNARRL
jgi:DNA-binding transcriptional LysR family regulator